MITKIHKMILWYHENCKPIFKKYIDKCFQLKKAAKKGTASYEIAKLAMNAVYGKTLQRPIDSSEEFVES